MKNFIVKYYLQLIIISGFFLLIIFMIFESRNIMVMIGEKSEELKKNQLDRVLTAEFLQNVHVFKKNQRYIEENIDIFEVILPDNDDEKIKLFSEIERIAEETNNTSVELAVAKAKEKKVKKKSEIAKAKEQGVDIEDRPSSLDIKITLFGTYGDLMYFLRKIESMQYYSRVLTLDITKTDRSPRKNIGIDDEEIELDEEIKDLIKTEMNISFYIQ